MGNIIENPKEISEAMNQHFAEIGPKLAEQIPVNNNNNKSPNDYIKRVDSSFHLKPVERSEVLKLLTLLDVAKATGLDNIPCMLLKEAADIVSHSLTVLFNLSMSKGIFPHEWKLARVTPIFKKGTKSDPGNYRPISVIPVVAKIFERLVHNQLYGYLLEHNILSNCQSGFRTRHSTETALLEATDHWYYGIDKGNVNAVLFLDLKKAFDTVDHKILVSKLKLYGFHESSLKWLISYLEYRQQKCCINNEISSSKTLNCGVPQGTILGPLLFLIYVNDLPNCLSKSTPRMYADDTNLTVTGKNVGEIDELMSEDLQNVRNWLNSNKLTLNATKTEILLSLLFPVEHYKTFTTHLFNHT